jgi:hypothetical protein
VRSLVFDLLLAAGAALAVAAFVFRSREAQRLLIWLRNAAWVYILLVFAVGAYRLWQLGF